jgi:large subunit ribosomal protein L25
MADTKAGKADTTKADKKADKNAESNKLAAEVRDQFGKGFARRIRAAGRIPAVIYGHGTDPQHVSLPGHEVSLILRKANQVLELDIAGTTQLALVKDVQKDPVHQVIEHLDLVVVRKGEKVTVDVPVHVEGESAAGTIAALDATTLSIEAEATHIPERITVDIEGAEEGTQIFAKDLSLPEGSTLVSDPETLVVNVTVPAAVDLGETEAAEGEEAAEGAEAAEGGEGGEAAADEAPAEEAAE